MRLWLVTCDRDSGVIIAPTRRKAQELRTFLRLRGAMVEVQHVPAYIRVCGWYGQIAETDKLLAALRA